MKEQHFDWFTQHLRTSDLRRGRMWHLWRPWIPVQWNKCVVANVWGCAADKDPSTSVTERCVLSKLASRRSSQSRCRGGERLFDNGRAITSFTAMPRLHLCMSICRRLVLLLHSTYSLPASLPPRLSSLPLIPHVDTFISLSYSLFVSQDADLFTGLSITAKLIF